LGDEVQVTIASAYPFHMMHQAQQMHRLDVLHRLLTAVPTSRTGVPRPRVRSRPYFAGVRHLARKVLPSCDRSMGRTVIRDFDRWAAGQIGDPSVVTALSGFATRTLEEAVRRNYGACCDRGSWHILEQQRVLEDEAARVGAEPSWFDPFIIDRELREYDLVDRIIVPSDPARQSFLRRGIDPAKVAKVPYGVDVRTFTPEPTNRRAGGIVSVGTIGTRKGQIHLVEAFRSLATQTATLTLVGPIDPGWARILDLRRGYVRTTGAVPRARVVAELQRAAVFVLASLEEGLALVIAQAMACGLPVVATEATGVGELVTDGVEGLVVPAGDSRALAAALECLLEDPQRAAEMGAAGRRRVVKLGGWDRYGLEIAEVFRAVHRERR